MKNLEICADLSLPLDTVTQAVGILAKRRAGKSYLARRFAEQLHAAGQQLVIVDPKGDWWGARSAADGKSPGMPIVILGGDHGDLPLEVDSGAVVARLVVEERVSVLLDLSLLRKHEVSTFMALFLEDLYRLKAHAEYRTPLMLFVDEADAIAPQKPQPNEMRMLGAMNDVVRRGGQRGLGCCVITQRSAVLSKDVLTQVQVLITLRTMSPQDLAAIKSWIDVHGTVEQQKVLMGSLPSLPIGDAWFWSPGWPTDVGIFQRSHVLPISTFDSGATPKAGEVAVAPKRLADVDLDSVRRQMSETIEKAKENDPKALRARIQELEAAVAAGAGLLPAPVVVFDKKKAEKLRDSYDEYIARAQQLLQWEHQELREIFDRISKLHRNAPLLEQHLDTNTLADDLGAFLDDIRTLSAESPADAKRTARKQRWSGETVLSMKPPKVSPAPDTPPAPTLPPGEHAMMEIVAQRKKFGASDSYVILCTGYRKGSVTSYASRLQTRGFIRREGSKSFPTDAGLAAVPAAPKLPTGDKLVEHYQNTLPPGEALVVGQLHVRRPLSLDQLVKLTGRPVGSVSSYVSRLRTRQIITGKSNAITFNPELGL